jgi:CRP-like cAMP-binding protein
MDLKTASILGKSPLFLGLTGEETQAIASCLDFRTASFEKGTFIQRRGDTVDSIGVIVSGSAYIMMEDYWGNRNILGDVGVGQTFGESFACMADEVSTVDVVANQRVETVFLSARRIITTCSSACEFHTRLIRNLLNVLAHKNLSLTAKTAHTARRTVREKILSYLSSEAHAENSPSFDISFDRQQLADYLSVERSALSKNLCALRDEGVISFRKNHFELH